MRLLGFLISELPGDKPVFYSMLTLLSPILDSTQTSRGAAYVGHILQ